MTAQLPPTDFGTPPDTSGLGVKGDFHTHVDESGFAVRCYHQCKTLLLSYSFWIGLTLGFPLEHFLWEKVWPFAALTKWLGL